jgi:hydrogenase maturation protease
MNDGILIACIGNIFLGDDGFGYEVAKALSGVDLGSSVSVVDYGIRGFDLAYALLEPWQAVILVDVVARGGAAGTQYLLQPADTASLGEGQVNNIDPHSMDPVRVLATARSLGKVSAEVFIVGCEPSDFGDELEGRMGLSEPVAAAIPETIKLLRDLVARLQESRISTSLAV